MIITLDKTGQLGNQLFEFGTLISNAIEHNSSLLNLHFNDYHIFFEGPNSSKFNKLKIRTSLGSRSIDRIFRRLSRSKLFKNLLQRRGYIYEGMGSNFSMHGINTLRKIRFKRGSWFVDFDTFYKHQKSIREYFTPKQYYRDRIQHFIKPLRNKHDLLIGLHVRRGDYKEFLGGKFYFETKEYNTLLQKVMALFPDKKNIGVVICSNAEILLNEFSGASFYKGLNHFIEDMYTLAECDYILGPPSTYTMWASFYGQKPLLKFRSKNQEISLSDFKLDKGY